ncbi:unnamed protein product [Rhizoctonia solani]|uniref:Uncharacterized protein n=1 Tax=Rhizoctonia solani TaxID=456999 RepID=A0A8H3ABK0_9AGAM|nr:unnamed protein product [Rhizoctonia solani]
MLLDPSIFGTDTLSRLIVDAREYHHLDTLLELSFTMFSSKGGKVTRKAYADSIFNGGYALERLPDEISNELASIHSVTNGACSRYHANNVKGRPQLFMTKDLSYCGTPFTQTPPSNVIILDHENLCMVFCDKNGESDVLTIPVTTIKSVELNPQDASRVVVEVVVAEPPLISSSREELAISDSDPPGSPLKIRVSIASSDIIGLKSALTARNLGSVLKDDNALTRHSSASTKISNAVFSIPLKKNRNPSNEQAEEMIRKYVNLPSSKDTSPSPPTEHIKSTSRAAQPQPLPPKASIVATPMRQVAPPEPEEPTTRSPPTPRPTLSPALHLPDITTADTSPVKTSTSAPIRTRRAAAEKSQRASKTVILSYADGSEISDVDLESIQEGHPPQTVTKTPIDDTRALPTPPRTRARAQETKLIAKTLVPSTPMMDDLPEVSSPLDVPSPSPKPTKKRKLIENNPFELLPLDPERPTKQKKIKNTDAVSGSQHIRPRHTAATRAKTKYGTISKRMRDSSPIESIHSADTKKVNSPPPKKAPAAPRGKKAEDPSAKGKNARMQTRVGKNDTSVSTRQTRSNAANTKPKHGGTVNEREITHNKDSKLDVTTNPEVRVMDVSEPPKRKRGRPPKNKPTALSSLPMKANSIEQPSPQPKPDNHDTSSGVRPTRVNERTETKPVSNNVDRNSAPPIQETSEDDDLLKRLSQAAKKALKPLAVDGHHAASLRGPEIEMEDPEVDVDTIDAPVQGLETHASKSTTHPADMTDKLVESVNTSPMAEPVGAHSEDESLCINASTSSIAKPSDSSKDSPPGPEEHIGVIRIATRASPMSVETDGHGVIDLDIVSTEKSGAGFPGPTHNPGNKLRHQQGAQGAFAAACTEAYVPTSQEYKRFALPKTPTQRQPREATERIHSHKIPTATSSTPLRQLEAPSVKDQRRTKLPPVFISVDSTNSDVGMEPSQEFAPPQPDLNPIRRPNPFASRLIPTSRPIVKPRSYEFSAPTNVKHAAVTRILFETSTQPSPKSALASPQRRTFANGTRPSVSFLEPPVPLSQRGISDSSAEGDDTLRAYRIEREKLTGAHSARTGHSILQIVDKLTEIQELIMLNLGEKVETVNAEARRAHAELTKGVVEEFDKMKTESELHHHILHKFESALASQAQAMSDGFGRISESNDRINARIKSMLVANARAGQNITKSTLDFLIPELFGALLTS